MKPEFEFERQSESIEHAKKAVAKFYSSGVIWQDLPEFIKEMFTRIKQTKVDLYWLAENPGMDSQLVYEKLTVFFNWLKDAETVAPPEHADVIQNAFDTIQSWQTYLADKYPVDTSKRKFAVSIFTRDDKNPEYMTNKNQPPKNKTRHKMEESAKRLAVHKTHILKLADSQPRKLVLTDRGYCSSQFMNPGTDAIKYINKHDLEIGTVKNWVRKHYQKK